MPNGAVQRALMMQQWPGNVRELRNAANPFNHLASGLFPARGLSPPRSALQPKCGPSPMRSRHSRNT